MALLPTPVSGRLLRWASDGTLENVTISDLLDQIARGTAPDPAAQKYWIDTSALVGTTTVNAPTGAMALAGGTPTIAAQRLFAVTLSGASMTMEAGAPTVAVASAGNFSVTAPGASMTMAGGTPSVSRTVALQPSGASMAMAGGTPTVSTVTSFSVTLTGASMTMGAGTATVATAGGAFSASDGFERTSLGSDWTTATGQFIINTGAVYRSSGTNLVSGYWASAPTSDAQSAWASLSDASGGCGPTVRCQIDGACYGAMVYAESDGELNWNRVVLLRIAADGSSVQLGEASDLPEGALWCKIEISGSSLVVSTGTNGTSWTTRISGVSDSALTGGRVGMAVAAGGIGGILAWGAA